MEDIAAYIILFSIGLGVLYAYQYRRHKPRQLSFSDQTYPECFLKVLVVKQTGKVKYITLRVIARKDFTVKDVKVELIDINRSFSYLHLNEKIALPPTIQRGKFADAEILFDEFKSALSKQDKTYQTFRFVVENDSGKIFKTHELTFNKNWTIYRPDSGKYN